MLSGPELGKAIEAARELKGVSKAALARHFGVKPPSVQDWVERGTIDKEKLGEVWEYFADVVGPEHWGLPAAWFMPSMVLTTGDGSAPPMIARMPTPGFTAPPSVRATVARLGQLLSFHNPARQQTIAGTLSRFAYAPTDEELGEELISLLEFRGRPLPPQTSPDSPNE